MQLFDVCAKREYVDSKNEKQVKWYKVGTIKAADSGKRYLRLYMMPQTEFFVFENTLPSSQENLPIIN
jgi:hypothetical protein